MLAPSDLEDDDDEDARTGFGTCQPDHVVYVTKMVEITRLRMCSASLPLVVHSLMAWM